MSLVPSSEDHPHRGMDKRGLALTSNLDLLRQHYGPRGAGSRDLQLASRGKKWGAVANNMQLLREHSRVGDRLYMEVGDVCCLRTTMSRVLGGQEGVQRGVGSAGLVDQGAGSLVSWR